MKLIGLCFAVLSLIFLAPVRAAGWTPPLTIDKAFVENSDLVIVYTTDGTVHTPGCTPNNWQFEASTDARRDRAYSTILSALLAGKKVQFWFDNACGAWNYHKATSVMILSR